MKSLRIIILLSLLAISVAASVFVLQNEKVRRHYKEDLVELSKIKYGLFNVDEWKVILADIISKKVEELSFEDTDKVEMHRRISQFLYNVINDFEERYYEENSKSVSGLLKSGVASITGTFDQLKKDIPTFTDQIIEFLEDERNREAIKGFVIEKLNEYADSTFAETDYTLVEQIVAEHGATDSSETITYLREEEGKLRAAVRPWQLLLIAIAIVTLVLGFSLRDVKRNEFLLMIAICLVYLFIGVFLPMIEIDARIAEMSFTLIGEPISFTDQVLYYKSKSILEIVHLMVFQSRLDLIAVGLLVLCFSVLFPITKLLSSVIYLFKPQVKNRRFFNFMIFRSGKWSMADVMVVAIFMAYIGFDGIISEQLRQMEEIARTLDMITTNESDLLFGFYAFISFVLLSLVLSHRMQGSKPN